MTELLLRTKLMPPRLPARLVARPRLADTLAQALAVPLTLVSAPAGFGKTVTTVAALRALSSGADFRLAWLSLEQGDDEPGRFWRYVIAALDEAVPGMGESTVAALQAPEPQPLPRLLTPLLNEIAILSAPLLLVLDDAHVIADATIYEGLTFLLEHAPPPFHLVLVTRADPPLPLYRLRARGQMVEMRAAALRFDVEEATAFLNEAMALSLTAEEVARLTARTEGWPVGLQLAALALQEATSRGTESDLVARLEASNRYAADYLAAEVLAQQTTAMQDFLLQTSVLERLCGSLCDAVTQGEGSHERLQQLARRNLFVTAVGVARPGAGEEQWFRYHQLFADLLRGRLQQDFPDKVPDLHRRAAAWYEAAGEVETAVEHAFAAKDYGRLKRILDRHARELSMQGRAMTLERWLRRLPPSWRQSVPQANMAFAWALLLRGRYEEMEPYLQAAAVSLAPGDGQGQGELSALRAALAGTQGRADVALAQAQQAINLVPEDDALVQALAHFALAGALREQGDTAAASAAYEKAIPLCAAAGLVVPTTLGRAHLGFLCLLQGQLRRAAATVRPVVQPQEMPPVAAAAELVLGMVYLEQNRLEDAGRHLQHVVSLAERSGHNAVAVQARLALARWQRAQGDIDAAQAALAAAATRVQQGVPGWVEPLLVAEQVQLWLAAGAVDTAVAVLAQADVSASGHVREILPLARAKVLYHRGDYYEAQRLLADIGRQAREAGRQGQVQRALLQRALVQDDLGADKAAMDDLEQALALAAPEGYVLIFLEAGARLRPLLARSSNAYARVLLDAFPEGGTAAVEALPEPLTDRERDVLALMAQGLTYRQIAAELVVSINTVRHHVKGLYGKLQVDNRTLAVEKARTLGLL